MSFSCAFPNCTRRATHWEKPQLPLSIRPFCASHYSEDECPNHIASKTDAKVCGRCGTHIDSLRPDEEPTL